MHLPCEGALAVGISPSGECVVIVCVSNNTVRLWLTSTCNYGTRVAPLNWTGVPLTRPFGNNTVSEFADTRLQVRLRYDVTFSACGRYAVVVDQNARWNVPMKGYACAIADLAFRENAHDDSHPRVMRIGRCEAEFHDQTPGVSQRLGRHLSTPMRAIQWGAHDVWVLSNRGLVVIHRREASVARRVRRSER